MKWRPTENKHRSRKSYLAVITLVMLIVLVFHLLEFAGIPEAVAEERPVLGLLARVALSVVVGILAGIVVLRAGPAVFPSEDEEELRILHAEYPLGERREYFNRLYVQIRWLACAGLLLLAAFVYWNGGRWDGKGALYVLLLTAIVGLMNLGFSRLAKVGALRRRGFNLLVLAELQIGFDLLALLLVLYYTGGVRDPLVFTYAIVVIMAGVLLDRVRCYVTALVAWASSAAIALGEMAGALGAIPFHLPPGMYAELHGAQTPAYVFATLGFHLAILLLVAYFTTAITDRLRMEERHGLAVRQRSELIMQTMGIGFAIWDREGVPDWLNPQMKTWLGVPSNGVSAQMPDLRDWTGGKYGAIEQTYRDGRIRSEERQRIDTAGNAHLFQVYTLPVLDANNQIYEVVEIVQDITERKRHESEMARSAQLATLGVMAAGFAHEVGNPLASISTRLRLLEEDHPPELLRDSLSLLQRQVMRIAQIVHGVAQFARPPAQIPVPCSINLLVTETLNLLQFHEYRKRCRIGTQLAYDLPQIDAIASQLQQVFLNLGINALEALPENGTLTVRTFVRDSEVCIAFVDTGRGLREEERAKVFDAFYSTKPGGLGLGLTVAHNLVGNHRGRIEISDNPGGGSVFTVVLPVASESSGAPHDIADFRKSESETL